MESTTLDNARGHGHDPAYLRRALGLIAAGLLSISCSADTEEPPIVPASLETVMAQCDPPGPVQSPIIIAQKVTGGYVTVSNSCTGLTFTAHLYQPSETLPSGHDYMFDGVAIDVQTAVPPVRKPPGQFAFQYTYDTPSRMDFSQTIPYTAFGLPADVCASGTCGSQISILFHLAITETLPGGGEVHQTGWSGDKKFTSGSWGYYIAFTPCCTCTIAPAPELISTCDGGLHYSAEGATCHWTFSSGADTIATSESCSGDLTISLPPGSRVDATVHVTSEAGCTGDGTTSATTRAALAVTAGGTDLSCAGGGSTGSATASATGGTEPYSYLWTPGGQTTQSVSGLAAGSYGVLVTDGAGCTTEGTVTIEEPPRLEVTISSDPVACSGGATGNASASATGGTPPYAYLWAPGGATTASLPGIGAGDYTVTVTDARGCAATESVTISEPPALHVVITSDDVECNGGVTGNASASASGGTGAYHYLWSSGATSEAIHDVAAGTYTVTVTDDLGCPDSATVTIGQPDALSVQVAPDDVRCNGDATGGATATVSGGVGPYTFVWSNGAFGATLAGVAAGPYTVTVTDANGCPASAGVTIGQPAPLGVDITSDDVECFGGSTGNATAVAVGGVGPYTFHWADGAAGAVRANLVAGRYDVTVTDVNGCPASGSVLITEPPQLGVAVTSDDVECSGDATGGATAVPSGGTAPYDVHWSTGATGETLSGVPAGEYSVTVTDANGCPASGGVTVLQPEPLSVQITSDNVACSGGDSGSATATPSGGVGPYTFLWSTGSTAAALSGLPAGDYGVTVTDQNGCPASAGVTITQPDPLQLEITADDVACSGDATGSATAVVSGGIGPYAIVWSNGTNGPALSGVPAGSYGVTVTDGNHCPTSGSVTIGQPPALDVGIDADTICGGLHYDAFASGGTPALATVVTVTGPDGLPGQFLELSRDVLSATEGPYTVTITVTDAKGCSASATDTVAVYTELWAQVVAGGSCPSDGRLYFTFMSDVSGGSEDVSYDWTLYGDGVIVGTDPELGPAVLEGTAFVDLPGEYYAQLVVHDNLTGCAAADSAPVKVWAPLALTLQASTESMTCPAMSSDEVTFSAAVTGGSGDYAVTWQGDQPGDTCVDGTVTCLIDGNGLCDTRSITATVVDHGAAECGSVTSAPGLYEKKTTVTATTH